MKNFLLTLLGKAASAIPGLRLVVEYLLVGLILVISGMTIHLWFTRHELAKKNTELTDRVAGAESMMRAQESALKMLRNARDTDAQTLQALQDENERLDKVRKSQQGKIKTLENENEVVRNYLAQRIPPDLACVLNRTCADRDKDRAAASLGQPSATVQTR